MSEFIKVYDNAVSEQYCNDIINWFEANQDQQFTRQETNDRSAIEKCDTAVLLPVGRNLEVNNGNFIVNKLLLEPIMYYYVTRYTESFPYLAKEMQRQTILQSKIQCTQPGGGYHLWHCEHSDALSAYRVASFVLYLNETSGGETEFLYQHQRVEPKTGRLVIFPAGYTHLHRGNPPLDKPKYIVTGWMEFC